LAIKNLTPSFPLPRTGMLFFAHLFCYYLFIITF
jgi:hypothetical protein